MGRTCLLSCSTPGWVVVGTKTPNGDGRRPVGRPRQCFNPAAISHQSRIPVERRPVCTNFSGSRRRSLHLERSDRRSYFCSNGAPSNCGGYGAGGYSHYINAAGYGDEMNILIRPFAGISNAVPLFHHCQVQLNSGSKSIFRGPMPMRPTPIPHAPARTGTNPLARSRDHGRLKSILLKPTVSLHDLALRTQSGDCRR